MEKYQVKRLRPLAILVCGLTLAPVALTPAGFLLEQTLPSRNTTHMPGTKVPPSQDQSPRATTTTTTTTSTTPVPATAATGTLEGMTLDAPIRRPGLLTESLA